ncbi:molybdopterin-guanine dinucleotide biosynthesis protein B [Halalkalibacter urbisdiaboli]|uniref:molybdopterin-guanine dinucleotide biosynthesis protein B n=1 Tax=Halalkalibacter urbisdiaboli TaxID=1960589 RepID=UPI001FD99501|nr:molybdopterin-guanine dinucleotide biosynthesis protein B [Halalkalibacter urbisdiaboli]
MGLNEHIWQVVGYSNSGKTTLVEKLLQYADANNKRVATIKHHGHGKRLTALDTGKDSWRHRQAGAVGCSVVADQTLQLQLTNEVGWKVSDILSFYEQLNLDAVLIEGYKQEDYKKIVVIRDKEHLELLQELTNVQAVILWKGIELSEAYRSFDINDTRTIGEWLLAQWEERKHD